MKCFTVDGKYVDKIKRYGIVTPAIQGMLKQETEIRKQFPLLSYKCGHYNTLLQSKTDELIRLNIASLII